MQLASIYILILLLISKPVSACTGCPAGYQCDASCNQGAQCSSGYYNTGGSNINCIQCPKGYYCPNRQSAVQCPSDRPWSQLGTSVCTTCPAGYDCTSAPSIILCADGKFNTGTSNSCTQCPAGYACPDITQLPIACDSGCGSAAGSTYCTCCDPGTYLVSATSTTCTACDSGYYSGAKSIACIRCPAGSYCPDAKIQPIACISGEYSLGETTSCTTCPAGMECASTSSAPVACSDGKFSLGGVTACISCPAGYKCTVKNAAPSTICDLGTYNTGGMTTCLPCPPGKLCKYLHQAFSGNCPDNYYQVGKTPYCSQCEAGFECDGLYRKPCSKGYYSTGMTKCTKCPLGSYCPTNVRDPLTCYNGLYCPEASVDYIECPPGYYCTNPSTAPQPCSSGTYSLGKLTSCITCPAGFFCSFSAQAPLLCPDGYVSDAGATKCDPCPTGSYCPTPVKASAIAVSSGNYALPATKRYYNCRPGYRCTSVSSFATICAPGTTSSISNTAACTPCPAGKACPTLQTTDIYDCPSGWYSLGSATYCTMCPAGSKCPSNNVAPVACSDGQYSISGSTTCTNCAIGYYCPTLYAPVVLPCPPGTYSAGTAKECTVCGPNTYCAKRDSAPACAAGTYSKKGSHVCRLCPGGYNCGSDPWVPCAEGTYSAEGDSSCQNCPAGSMCPKISSKPILCPAGTSQGSTNQIRCIVCLLGTYSNEGATSCTTCPAGSECPATHTSPRLCPPGTYSAAGQYACTPCTPGKYCAAGTIDTGLVDCPTGYYCNYMTMFGFGGNGKLPCPAGTYRSSVGATRAEDCSTCTAGKYCEAGTTTPVACPAGHYCPAGTKTPNEFPCPDGTYRTATGGVVSGDCINCAPGSYCPSGSAALTSCPPGYFCPTTTGELTNNNLMAIGYYSLGGASTSTANNCPAGAYCPIGTAYPILCPPGTYNSALNKGSRADCAPCPAGKACPKYGTTSSVTPPDCPKGYYCPAGTENPRQFPCPAGTYNDATGVSSISSCQQCTQGYGCEPGTNSDTNPMKKCIPGYYCPAGSKSPREVACAAGSFGIVEGQYTSASACNQNCEAGYYCLEGSDRLTGECWEGFYCTPNSKKPTEVPCLAGTYSNVRGLSLQSQCKDCPAGYYCPAGLTAPIACPSGTYNSAIKGTSISSCLACDAGNYCLEAATSKTPCGIGKYSPASAKVCYDCQPGHFCPSATTTDAVMVANSCTAGYYCPLGAGDIVNNAIYKCPAGKYCPAASETPIDCQPGQVSVIQSSSCITITGGAYTTLGNGVGTPCLPGYYCDDGSWSATAKPCPIGTYRSTPGATKSADCATCTAGYYCPIGTANPIICPMGYFCTSGQGLPSKCPIGTYGGSFGITIGTLCNQCDAGTYCSLPGLPSPEGLCDSGYFCLSGSTSSTPASGICPAGGFCETGSRLAKSCPPGRFNPNPGGKDLDACQLCTPGQYCSGEAKSTTTGDCAAGFYCPSGSYMPNMRPARPGYYTLVKQYQETPCDEGYYNPYYAQSACFECPAGFLCLGTANTGTFINCPPGNYCPQKSSVKTACLKGTYNPNSNGKSNSDCLPCPPGKFCSVEGLYQPGDGVIGTDPSCDPGYYCKSKAIEKTPTKDLSADNLFGPCEGGYYCPKGVSAPLPCPPGTFSPNLKLSAVGQCSPCTAGSYCSKGGLSAVEGDCGEGYYCEQGSKVPKPNGKQCPIGNYCPQGSSVKIPCSPGSYQDEEGRPICKDCPEGFYCPQGTSSLSGLDCPVGFYCPLRTPSSSSFPCPIGRYNPRTNAYLPSHCILCDPGYYCQGTGNFGTTQKCDAGYYCKLGSPIKTPPSASSGAEPDHGGICPIGSYCPLGSAVPILCDGGKYCSTTGLPAPQGNCQAGYYCKLGATSATPTDLVSQNGAKCPPGYYCPIGSDSPTSCPPGTYSASYGNTALSNCIACPSGKYCKDAHAVTYTGSCDAGYYCKVAVAATIGYTIPNPPSQICPKGNKCPSGTIDVIACTNSYQDLLGQGDCKSCPAGYYCPNTATEKILCQPRLGTISFYCPAGIMDQINCPAGTYNAKDGTSSIADCIKCPPGYYCPVDAAKPMIIPCDAGYYCKEQGASTSYGDGKCPSGYYCPAATYDPIPCPAGRYCDVEGLTDAILSSDTYKCKEGYYCASKSVTPTPTDGTKGDICKAGYFCPKGTPSPIACPIGTYRTLLGGISSADCTQCTAGQYCPSRGLSAPVANCPAGYYCPTGNMNEYMYPCLVGSRCPSGSANYEVCPDKTFQNIPAQPDCQDCPERFYCKNSGVLATAKTPKECPAGYYCVAKTDTPTKCPAGTYSNRMGLRAESECDQCRPGYYCATAGLTTPTDQCQEGYYCTGMSKSATPNDATGGQCPKGAYCPKGTITPILCPPGTYNDLVKRTKVDDCVSCQTGYYCPLRGATSMDLKFGTNTYKCLAGYLCLTKAIIPNPTDGTTGYMCNAGKYCIAGATTEEPCDKGTYNPDSGQGACLDCPAGKLCDTTGMTTPNDCLEGYYCPSSSTKMIACPSGTYSPLKNLESVDECFDCDPGQYCTGGKSAPDGACLAGYVCPKKSPVGFGVASYSFASNAHGLCPTGHSCDAGSSAPTPCSIGTYNDAYGQSTCKACTAGKYCDELGLVTPVKDCAAGHICTSGAKHARPLTIATEGGRLCNKGNYCPSGTTTEKPCSPGRYEPRFGSSECQICPAGFYCPSYGMDTPITCPVKYYCPAGSSTYSYCPDGTFGRTGHDRLEKEDQCTPCPTGKWCKAGEIKGGCDPGYFCESGSVRSTQKLCDAGYYCDGISPLPIRCADGKFNMDQGGKSSADCKDCTAGNYCISGSPVPITCPRGHYCGAAASKPEACGLGYYQPAISMTQVSDCKACPAGYYCYEKAIYDYEMYPCPMGKYCPCADLTSPDKNVPLSCPAGTYRNATKGISKNDCSKCPGGFICTEGTINPRPCKGGTYCPAGSISELKCPAGRYCPPKSISPKNCPKAYYCVEGSAIYTKCLNGYYCPENSALQTLCPSGSVGSNNPDNYDASHGCTLCTPGFYSYYHDSILECMPCTAGYVCLGGTTTATPIDVNTDKGQKCPAGHYCPEGTYDPTPCPKGTYNNENASVSIAACKRCPDKQFNPESGKSACRLCGKTSQPTADALTCECIGKYRAYMVQTSECLCQPTYDPPNGEENVDKTSNCQPKIYDRCDIGQARDSKTGKCVQNSDCATDCQGGNGVRDVSTGLCLCEKVDLIDMVCNDLCREKQVQLSVSYTGELRSYDPVTGSQTTINIPKLFGNMSFATEGSKVTSIALGMKANYKPNPEVTSAITGKRRLEEHHRLRLMQSTTNSDAITNPIICLNLGDTMLFQVKYPDYPSYDKDNLLNSNPLFDYSSFLLLKKEMDTKRENADITTFAFTFIQSGRYVFKSNQDPTKLVVIGVMAKNEKCSDSDKFIQPITSSSLLKLGVTQNKEIILTPDWGLIFGLIAALLFGTPILIGLMKCLSSRSWINKRSTYIEYKGLNSRMKTDKFEPKGTEWKREKMAPAGISPLLREGATAGQDAVPGLLIDEDNPLIAKHSRREKEILEMRVRENQSGVHEIDPSVFHELYKELQYHAKFVKEEFAKKAGLDSENIKKIFADVDKLKLLMQEKLQNIAKSYGRGIKLVFTEKQDKEGGLFIEEEEEKKEEEVQQEEEKKETQKEKQGKEEDEQEHSDSDTEKPEAKKVEIDEKVFEEMEHKDQVKADEMAEKLREEQVKVQEKWDSSKDDGKKKFEAVLLENNKLSPDDRAKLMEDYDKNADKLQKLLMIEEQSGEERLQQLLEQRKLRKEQIKRELEKMEEKKAEIANASSSKQKEIDAQKEEIRKVIEVDIDKEAKEERDRLEEKRQRELQEVRNKFQNKLSEDMPEYKRNQLLDKFGNKMKELEDQIGEERKRSEEDIKMRLDMKRQSRRAEKEAELKKKEKELKEQQQKQLKEINAQVQVLKDNLQSENIEEVVRKVQAEPDSSVKEEGEFEQLAKEAEAKRLQEEEVRRQKEEELKKIEQDARLEEKEEIKRLEQERIEKERTVEHQIRVMKDRKKEALKQAEKASSDEEKKKVLEDYMGEEKRLKDKLSAELEEQNNSIEAQLAERRKKRAKKETDARAQVEMEIDTLKKSNRKEEFERKRAIDKKKLKEQIEKIKMELPGDEVPFAVEKLIDEKHLAETAELLKRQFLEKADKLKESMERILKEKAQALLDIKADIDGLKEKSKRLADRGLIKKEDYDAKLEEIKKTEADKMKEWEFKYAQAQSDLEIKTINEMEKANIDELVELKKDQANEKKSYVDAYSKDDFVKLVLAGDAAKIQEDIDNYQRTMKNEYDDKIKEVEEKKRKIELLIQQDEETLKALEAQSKKLEDDKKKAEESKKKKDQLRSMYENRKAEVEGNTVDPTEKAKLLESYQKELEAMLGEAPNTLISQVEEEKEKQEQAIKARMAEKLKQREALKKKKEEEMAAMQKEQEKALNEKVKEIQKVKGMETEEEKGNLMNLISQYDKEKFVFDKAKALAGIEIEVKEENENLLKGILEGRKTQDKDKNKIDLSFELLFERLRKLESSVGTITGVQFGQISAGFMDLMTKLQNISTGNVPKPQKKAGGEMAVVEEEPSSQKQE